MELLEQILKENLSDEKIQQYVEKAICKEIQTIMDYSFSSKVKSIIHEILDENFRPLITTKVDTMKPMLRDVLEKHITKVFQEKIKNYEYDINDYDFCKTFKLKRKDK